MRKGERERKEGDVSHIFHCVCVWESLCASLRGMYLSCLRSILCARTCRRVCVRLVSVVCLRAHIMQDMPVLVCAGLCLRLAAKKVGA